MVMWGRGRDIDKMNFKREVQYTDRIKKLQKKGETEDAGVEVKKEWGEKERLRRWKEKGTENDAEVYAIFSCRKEKDKMEKAKQVQQKTSRNQGYINNIYLKY